MTQFLVSLGIPRVDAHEGSPKKQGTYTAKANRVLCQWLNTTKVVHCSSAVRAWLQEFFKKPGSAQRCVSSTLNTYQLMAIRRLEIEKADRFLLASAQKGQQQCCANLIGKNQSYDLDRHRRTRKHSLTMCPGQRNRFGEHGASCQE